METPNDPLVSNTPANPYAEMIADDSYFKEREKRLALRGQARLHVIESAAAVPTADKPVQEHWSTDIFRGVGNGIVGFGQSIASLADTASEMFGGDLIEDESILDKKAFGETTTFAGKLFESATQLVTALFPVSFGVGAAAKIAGITSTLGKSLATGAAADFLAFKGNVSRLSNLFEDTALANPLTAYLAADESQEDSIEGRMKSVIEGMGLGGITHALMTSFKTLKAYSKATTPAQAQAIAAATAAQANTVQSGLSAAQLASNAEKAGTPYATLYLPQVEAVDPAAMKSTVDAIKSAHASGNLNLNTLTEAFDGMTEQIAGHSMTGDMYGKAIDDVFAQIHDEISAVVSNTTTKTGALDEFARDVIKGTTSLPVEYAERLVAEVGVSGQAVQDAMTTLLKGKLLDRHLSKQVGRIFTDLASGNLPAANAQAAELLGYQTLEMLGQLRAGLHRLISGSGRLLQAQNIKFAKLADISVDTNLMRDVDKLAASSAAGGNKQALFARLALAGNNSTAILAAVPSTFEKMGKASYEYFVNSLLSGPGTFTVNAIGTGLQTVLRPLERMLGGALRGDLPQVREAARTWGFMFRGVKDSLKMAVTAARTGISPLTGQASEAAIKMSPSGSAIDFLRPVVNFIGGLVRTPSRILGGTDEFFKQITYRAEMYAKYTDEALGKGMLTSGYKGSLGHLGVAKYADEAVHNHLISGARDEQGLLSAARATFTEDFKPRSLAAHVSALVAKVPGLKLFVPFIRTPINVMREAVGHTPFISQMLTTHRQALKAGGREASEITGKIAMGNLLFFGGVIGAFNGTISGSGGNMSKTERERKMLDGWRPYSIQVGDKRIDFGRLDPLGVVLGIAADYAEIAQYVTPDEQQNIAGVMAGVLANNVTNKTYLRGLSDLIDAVTDVDGGDIGDAFKRITASFVAPSALKYLANEIDPYLREARELVDQVKARTLASTALMPKRDLLGQPVEQPGQLLPGIKQTTVSNDPVRKALASLPVSSAPPAPRLGRSVDLRQFKHPESGQTAHDRYQELVGVVKIGGKDLHTALAAAMEKPFYQRLEPNDHTGLARADVLSRIIDRYRARAQKAMLKEFPSIRAAVAAEKNEVINARKAARTASFKTWVEQTVAAER